MAYDRVQILEQKPFNVEDIHDLQSILDTKMLAFITDAYGAEARLEDAAVSISGNVVTVNGTFYLDGRKFDFTTDQYTLQPPYAGADIEADVYLDVEPKEITFADDPSIAMLAPVTRQYIETSVRYEWLLSYTAVNEGAGHAAPTNGYTYKLATVNASQQTCTNQIAQMPYDSATMSQNIKTIFEDLQDNNGDTYLTSDNAIDEHAEIYNLFSLIRSRQR